MTPREHGRAGSRPPRRIAAEPSGLPGGGTLRCAAHWTPCPCTTTTANGTSGRPRTRRRPRPRRRARPRGRPRPGRAAHTLARWPLRRPAPPGHAAPLRLPPRGRWRPRELGRAARTHAGPGRAPHGDARRGPPDRVLRLRGRHPGEAVRRGRRDRLGLGHLGGRGARPPTPPPRSPPANSSSPSTARSCTAGSRSSGPAAASARATTPPPGPSRTTRPRPGSSSTSATRTP